MKTTSSSVETLKLNRAQCEAIESVASALRDLGNGNAATNMGAIEALGVVIKEGSEAIASGLHAIAEAIRSKEG